MKPILSIFLISLLTTSLLSNEPKSQVQESEKKLTMTDEEFLKKFMQIDKEVEEEKKKTEELRKLRKTAEELVKTLGVDK